MFGFVHIGNSFNYNIKMNQDIRVNDLFKNNLHKMKAQNHALKVYKNKKILIKFLKAQIT